MGPTVPFDMIEYKKHVLDNGLVLLHHFDPDTTLGVINVLYKVGARNEVEHKTGFAHLFEHLMFGGSANIPSYDEPLQLAGGENNAFTNNDITNYYLTVPAENIETGFWLESDRMLQLDFSEKSLDVQRKVVCEEFKQRYLTQPYGDVWFHLRALAYKVHPYRWPTIGKELKHIEDATLEDVKSFFYSHYAPNNAVLVVAGNVVERRALQLAEQYFAEIPERTLAAHTLPQEPKQDALRYKEVFGQVPQDALYLAFHIPARTADNYPASDLLTDVLSGGQSGRLYISLVKVRRLFTDVNAYVTGDLDPGLLVIEGRLNPGISHEVGCDAIWEVLQMLRDSPVDSAELEKVKNKARTIIAFGETNVLNKAMNLALAEYMGDANMVNTELSRYEAVDSEALQLAAQEIFNLENCSRLDYKIAP